MTDGTVVASRNVCVQRHSRRSLRCAALLTLALLLGLALALPALAEISIDSPVTAKILYDGSGSMYPGYSPGVSRPTDSAVVFVHQTDSFKTWLKAFVAAMRTQCNVNKISIEAFKERNVHIQLLPETPIGSANTDAALRQFQEYYLKNGIGQHTFLEEQLEQATHNFEGLLWFITDNMIDTGNGPEIDDVKRLFLAIKNTQRYRSVFMFKLPVVSGGRTLNVAVYGFLVSSAPLSPEVATALDERMRKMAESFDGHEYVKFKDLSVNSIALKQDINITPIESSRSGLFSENHTVQLERGWKVVSKLTQHSIEKASCSIAFTQPFVPDSKSVKQFGIKNIDAKAFASITTDVAPPEIPPREERQISTKVSSRHEISISPTTLGNRLKLALSGAVVEYSGTATVKLSGVKLKLVPQHLNNIYGIEHAAEIFGFEKTVTLGDIAPLSIPVSFKVVTGAERILPLALVLLLLLAGFGFFGWFLFRPELCKVSYEGSAENIALRRMGSKPLAHLGVSLGLLQRDFGGDWRFNPDGSKAAVSIQPTATAGKYSVAVKGSPQTDPSSFSFSLDPRKGRLISSAPDRRGGGPPGKTGTGGVSGTGPKAGPRPLRK